MLGIEIVLLADRYTATKHDDWDAAEWPPHPVRVFSALVAAWGDAEVPDPEERAALAWLEEQPPPVVCCDPSPARRNVVDVYVPVNDAAAGARLDGAYARLVQAEHDERTATTPASAAKAAKALAKARSKAVTDSKAAGARAQGTVSIIPELRVKQARTFPTVTPAEPVVRLLWPGADPSAHLAALDQLAGRVARLGHSSTLVSCQATDEPSDGEALARFVPAGAARAGELVLRVPAPGLLDLLEAAHSQHGGVEPRVLPAAEATYEREVDGAPEVPRPLLGGAWVVLALPTRPRLPVTRALDVAAAVRGALISHAPEPVTPLLSGHQARSGPDGPDTPPADRPHLAVVPLPAAGHPRSSGHLLGVALVLPAEVAEDERAQLDAALDAWRRAGAEADRLPLRVVGRRSALELDLGLVVGPTPIATLRRSTWCRPATEYASVTPVALDRFPRHLFAGDADKRAAGEAAAAADIAAAAERAGLPRPVSVSVQTAGPLAAIPDSGTFPALHTGQGASRRPRLVVHARLRFAEPVAGPVLLGAGRYRGYGLCLPVPEGEQ